MNEHLQAIIVIFCLVTIVMLTITTIEMIEIARALDLLAGLQ